MMRLWIALACVAVLAACGTTPVNLAYELDLAKKAIADAREADAERCAPELLADAESSALWAAHELAEGFIHPGVTRPLIDSVLASAKEAQRTAEEKCPKLPPVVIPEPVDIDWSAPPPPPPPEPDPEVIQLAPQEIIVLEGVNFEVNSTELTPSSLTTLDKVVNTLTRRTDIRVEVSAHTDSTGSGAYNLKLSERRAASALRYLVEHGVDPAQLEAKGYGEARPIDDNATKAGRAKNRRVELHVLNEQ
ncbi:MAG: OmpA family protein [Mariprofundaceae bacterium]